MRTTVTLDPDVEVLIRRKMRAQKLTFKQALNDAIRSGLGGGADVGGGDRFETPVASLGRPTISLDRALQIAAELDDEAVLARLRAGG